MSQNWPKMTKSEAERAARACLENAAQDMLDALIALRDAGPNGATNFLGWHSAYAEAIAKARAAIAKAIGRED